MADKYPGIKRGPTGSEAITINRIADEAISIGSPVIAVAPATGELDVRVEPNASAGVATVVGVVVDGDNRGTFGGSDENSASAAGEAVSVCTKGRCKVRVDGSTGTSAISIGDGLAVGATDGYARQAVTGDFVFAKALQASTVFGDFILCDVDLEGIL